MVKRSPRPQDPDSFDSGPAAAPPDASPSFWQQRLGLAALRYPIPVAANTVTYSLGALTLVSFALLVLTGFWMAQFYNPSPAGAHDSVLYLITRAPFGDFARNLHFWSASAMVVSIVAHVAWVLYRRAYRAPREITWYAGLGLAGLLFLLVITGTILRNDQEGYEALAHFLAGAELVGGFGYVFSDEFTPSAPILTRIFALHTSLLPLGMALLLALHLWLIRVLGLSAPGPKSEVFSRHLRKITSAGLLLMAGLILLAIALPEGLGQRPVPGHELTKPFWPLLWIYALESLTGMWAVIWAPLAVFVFLAVVPLLDRRADRPATALRAFAAVLLLVLIALGIWAGLSPPQEHLGM